MHRSAATPPAMILQPKTSSYVIHSQTRFLRPLVLVIKFVPMGQTERPSVKIFNGGKEGFGSSAAMTKENIRDTCRVVQELEVVIGGYSDSVV